MKTIKVNGADFEIMHHNKMGVVLVLEFAALDVTAFEAALKEGEEIAIYDGDELLEKCPGFNLLSDMKKTSHGWHVELRVFNPLPGRVEALERENEALKKENEVLAVELLDTQDALAELFEAMLAEEVGGGIEAVCETENEGNDASCDPLHNAFMNESEV